MMASTFCAMKLCMALIWFSCFCWASENLRSIPRFAASSWMFLVCALRQSLSEPICEKPITSFLPGVVVGVVAVDEDEAGVALAVPEVPYAGTWALRAALHNEQCDT